MTHTRTPIRQRRCSCCQQPYLARRTCHCTATRHSCGKCLVHCRCGQVATSTARKGLSIATQPTSQTYLRLDNAAYLFRVDGNPDLCKILKSPLRIRLPRQIGIVVNRLDIRKLLQARVKSCSTQSQTPRSLFGGKHSLFLHRWNILIRFIILIDKTNVKAYNTNWTSKTWRKSCHSQNIADLKEK